jgi:D-alanyl-D-alanine carboxypeptidase
VDGLKTGYTRKSGYHLVATARRGGQRLIAVVMDARNRKIREREAMRLLNLGFQQDAQPSPGHYDEVELAPALSPVPPVKTAKGSRGI